MAVKYASVDEYIASFPPATQDVLRELRKVVSTALPDATETISYQMPTLVLRGKAVLYFAGWKSHVSVYPIPAGDDDFERQIAPYRNSKGTLKFALNQRLPGELIGRVAALLGQQERARP